jgi:hypothetical protein
MPHQLTVTGKTGPDRTVTAAVLLDVQRADFQLVDKRLQVHLANQSGNQIKEFDLSPTTTVTFSITSGNYTMVVS